MMKAARPSRMSSRFVSAFVSDCSPLLFIADYVAPIYVDQTARSQVAVSQKCCWCCWRLFRYLDTTKSAPKSRPPAIDPPNIVLFGSHSTIYPWSPPPIGVPIEFLRQLKAELEAILIHTLKEGSKSTRHAPARSSYEGDYLEVGMVDVDAVRAELVAAVRLSLALLVSVWILN